MTKDIAQAKNESASVYLSQYIDTHKYEITFIVDCAVIGDKYTTRRFKSFSAACKHFNRLCEAHQMNDKILW
jgi:hypothetical protein